MSQGRGYDRAGANRTAYGYHARTLEAPWRDLCQIEATGL